MAAEFSLESCYLHLKMREKVLSVYLYWFFLLQLCIFTNKCSDRSVGSEISRPFRKLRRTDQPTSRRLCWFIGIRDVQQGSKTTERSFYTVFSFLRRKKTLRTFCGKLRRSNSRSRKNVSKFVKRLSTIGGGLFRFYD